MTKFKGMIAAVAALGAMALLAGCGNAPGESDVREAVRGRMVSWYGATHPDKPMSDQTKQELDEGLAKIKVAGCKAADPKNGFNCDWTAPEMIAGIAGNSGRLVKGDSGWMLMKAGE